MKVKNRIEQIIDRKQKKSKKNNKKKQMKILTEKTKNVWKCKEIKLTEFEPYV